MKTKWLIGLVIAVVAIAGVYAVSRQATENSKTAGVQDSGAMMKKEEGVMDKKDNAVMAKNQATSSPSADKMMESDTKMGKNKMMEENKQTMQKHGAYKDYSPSALAEASKDNGKAVLFFWAAWCPNCKTTNEAFTSRGQEIPAGTTVLKVNYDTEKELKTKYGVTYQHTFVQVGTDGNQIAKWNGGDIDALRANIK